MVSSLSSLSSSTSSPNNYYYKHPISVPFLGFPSQHDQIARPNDNNHNFTMWLDQDDSNFSNLFCTNYGDVDDLVVPEFANFDCHLAYPIISQGGNCDFLPTLSDGKVYGNISPVEYRECSGESSCYGVGSYQVYENRDDNIANNMLKTYLLSNNHGISTMESSGIQLGEKSCSERNVKVGKYSVEERKARILRYLKKRNQRNFNKTIKYACRKSLADRRVRIHGRFAKNHEDDQPQMNETVKPHDYNLGTPYPNIDKNEEYYEDDWLQQAMAWPNCFLIN